MTMGPQSAEAIFVICHFDSLAVLSALIGHWINYNRGLVYWRGGLSNSAVGRLGKS